MDAIIYLRALAALGLVLALIWGGVWLVRRYGGNLLPSLPQNNDKKTLAILERMDLPHRKTLVRVKDGEREHLLLLSATGEQIVSTQSPMEAEE